MKKLTLLLYLALPLLVSAQNGCNFFDFRKLEIQKTTLNTAQSDFGPAFVEDELWFSAFTDEEIRSMAKSDKKDFFYNLYNVKTDEDGNVTGVKNVQSEAISAGYHAGPVSYCAATGELFVTLSNFDNPEIKNNVYQKADIRLKIIITKKINGAWTLTEEFPHNNPLYSVGHPAISVTGDSLFYASNKPDSGFGESDIYMSVRKNGKWGEPVNLGEKINSAFDEMFPFFFDGSVLFYATNKAKNKKDDFNLMYICKSGDSFGDSKTLDGFNTKKDDFGLIIHPNGKAGYFVSRRNGGIGDDDIYKVTFKGEHQLELAVLDKKTLQNIPNPKVKFSDNIPGILSGTVVTRLLPENSTILTTSEIEGYQNSSKNITSVGKTFGIIKDTIWVEKVEVGQKFVLENIFYDYDKWDIIPESEVELNKLIAVMKNNPSWKVELGSHTDARGTDSYNEILSQKRSDSAVEYIIKNGVGNNRIIAKGYGESQLINHCKNGVECPDEVHRQNRRTEFKILEMDGK